MLATPRLNRRWPNGLIPWRLGPDSQSKMTATLAAVDHFHTAGVNIRYPYIGPLEALGSRPTTTDLDRVTDPNDHHVLIWTGTLPDWWVEVRDEGGCSAKVGCQRRPAQPLRAGSGCRVSQIAHEFLHTVGFRHENQRASEQTGGAGPTRHWDRMETGTSHNFSYAHGIVHPVDVWDEESLNCYQHYYFAHSIPPGPGGPPPGGWSTITKDGGIGFGSRGRLSPLDVEGINMLYPDAPQWPDATEPPPPDPPDPPPVEYPEYAELQEGRFRVTCQYRDPKNDPDLWRPARSGLVDGDTMVMFFFFSRENLEVQVKVLDGRIGFPGANGFWWVWASPMTDVPWAVRVQDLDAGTSLDFTSPLRTYRNNQAFQDDPEDEPAEVTVIRENQPLLMKARSGGLKRRRGTPCDPFQGDDPLGDTLKDWEDD